MIHCYKMSYICKEKVQQKQFSKLKGVFLAQGVRFLYWHSLCQEVVKEKNNGNIFLFKKFDK